MKYLLVVSSVVQVCLSSWITDLVFNVKQVGTADPIKLGDPLFLTPLIARGDIQLAKERCLVGSPFNRKFETSYSGFITINETCNSNLFFWFFLSKNDPTNDPVVLYLAGGPGDASTSSVFEGPGPFYFTHTLEDNANSWNQPHNVLFVDSPVGSGFSFTHNSDCYARTLQDVAQGLHDFLQQFYELFPEYKSNPLFLSGVNYSVKDVLELAFMIHNKKDSDLNLKGLILGGPMIDPGEQIDRSEFLYQLGFVDRNTRDDLKMIAEKIKQDLQNKNLKDINPDEFERHLLYIDSLTEGVSNLNILKDKGDDVPPRTFEELLLRTATREALHVGNSRFMHHNSSVKLALRNTFMESVKSRLEFLLEFYHILIYAGQLDGTTPYAGLAILLNSLQWSGSNDYVTAFRSETYEGGNVESFMKEFDKLTDCCVRYAGHYVHMDNPRHLQKIIYEFTKHVSHFYV